MAPTAKLQAAQKIINATNELKSKFETYSYLGFNDLEINECNEKLEKNITRIKSYITLFPDHQLGVNPLKNIFNLNFSYQQKINDLIKANTGDAVLEITENVIEKQIEAQTCIVSHNNEKLEELLYNRNLLDLSLEPNIITGHESNSLLMLAVDSNNLPAVQMLCQSGAQLDFDADDENLFEKEYTPFLAACRQNNIPIMEYLLNQGANRHYASGILSETALTIALKNQNYELFKKLINGEIAGKKIDFNYNNQGDANLNVKFLIEEATIEAVKVVLDHVENIDFNQISNYASDNQTFLMECFTEGGIRINDDFQNHEQYNLSPEAKQKYVTEMNEFYYKFKTLVERGLDINWQNEQGNSLLHEVIDPNNMANRDFAEIFLHLGANQYLPNNIGITPLDLAKQNGDPIIQDLFDKIKDKYEMLIPKNRIIMANQSVIPFIRQNKRKSDNLVDSNTKHAKIIQQLPDFYFVDHHDQPSTSSKLTQAEIEARYREQSSINNQVRKTSQHLLAVEQEEKQLSTKIPEQNQKEINKIWDSWENEVNELDKKLQQLKSQKETQKEINKIWDSWEIEVNKLDKKLQQLKSQEQGQASEIQKKYQSSNQKVSEEKTQKIKALEDKASSDKTATQAKLKENQERREKLKQEQKQVEDERKRKEQAEKERETREQKEQEEREQRAKARKEQEEREQKEKQHVSQMNLN